MNIKVPYRFEDIDLNKIKYSQIKSNNDKTIIYLKYFDNMKLKNLVFQSPSIYNINTPEKNNNFYNLDIPLKCKTVEKQNEFITFLNNLDNKIITDAKNNSNWFSNFPVKKIKFQKTIRNGNTEYPNMLRVKILDNNNFQTLLQINNKNKIKPLDIPINSWVKSILEVYAIWINNEGFGLYIRPILMSFTPDQTDIYNYKLLDESDEMDDVVNTIVNTKVNTDNNNDSIFIKNENEIMNNNESTIMEMPNSFEELKSSENDINFQEDLSNTSE